MKAFKIIPVIDILNSTAVHAKKGLRKEYKPLSSSLFQSSNPIEIIRKIKKIFNLFEFYIADLDAIIHKSPNFQLLKKLLNISDIKVILDPGITDLEEIYYYKEFKIKKLILGLETIKSFKVINQSLEVLNQSNLIISIDMYKGEILSKAKGIRNKNLIEIIERIESLGIKSLILLDLFRVGQKIGGIPPLYLNILKNFNGDIFVGGGIRDFKDVLDYKEQNFSGVLIATALYDGTIDVEKLRN
ncbi:MAG: HisA/HisF-related TIM barrel protein, partial [Candidatus Hodarchaeota archaeon]